MNKLILKLPLSSQRLYTQYITSAAVKADSATSRWEKFWSWMETLHDSAIQASLMHMCDKGATVKSNATIKSGVTCNSCGWIGHYARNCPSKSSNVTSVRVNLAVTKITTRDEYKKHLLLLAGLL